MDHTTQLFSFYRRHAGVGTQSPVTLEKPLPLSFMVIKHCSALSQAPQVPGPSPTYILKFRSALPDAQRDKNNKGDARFLFFILIKKKGWWFPCCPRTNRTMPDSCFTLTQPSGICVLFTMRTHFSLFQHLFSSGIMTGETISILILNVSD